MISYRNPGHAQVQDWRLEEGHVQHGRRDARRIIDEQGGAGRDDGLREQLYPCRDAIGITAPYLEPIVDEADDAEADEGTEGDPNVGVRKVGP